MIYRDVLNRVLAEGLEESIRLGARFVRYEEGDDAVTAHFADGSCERGAVLVGADGVWSPVRAQLLPAAGASTEDQVVWRSVVRAADFDLGEQAFVIGRNGTRGGWMHTGDGLVYWAVAQLGADVSGPADVKAETLALTDNLYDGGWDFPMREFVEATPAAEILRDPVSVVPWLDTWVSMRVALAGDAAHAMSPHTASGASIGIEDAVVLAQHLATADVGDALAKYDMERRADSPGSARAPRRCASRSPAAETTARSWKASFWVHSSRAPSEGTRMSDLTECPGGPASRARPDPDIAVFLISFRGAAHGSEDPYVPIASTSSNPSHAPTESFSRRAGRSCEKRRGEPRATAWLPRCAGDTIPSGLCRGLAARRTRGAISDADDSAGGRREPAPDQPACN